MKYLSDEIEAKTLRTLNAIQNEAIKLVAEKKLLEKQLAVAKKGLKAINEYICDGFVCHSFAIRTLAKLDKMEK